MPVKDQITNALWIDGFCQRCSAMFAMQNQPKIIISTDEGTWPYFKKPDTQSRVVLASKSSLQTDS